MRIIILILSLGLCLSIHSQEINDWSDYVEVYNQKGINSDGTEFGTTYWNDKVVFVKSRPRQKILDKKTKETYFDLYLSDINKISSLVNSQPISPIINSEYHEGPSTFSQDGSKIFFTRVDYSKGQFKMTNDKEVQLKIFESQFENGTWGEPQRASFNAEQIASAHPTLSADGSYLIFASDRPEGYGKMDLYITYKNNNQWSTPINLGPEINTSENDWFPFISKSGFLFYATDGKGDSNGMDIYITSNQSKQWIEPTRLPYPINTRHDDFALITGEKATSGYFSSNRPSGQGKDDIFGYNSLVSLYVLSNQTYNDVVLHIKDASNGQSLSDVQVNFSPISEDQITKFDRAIFDAQNNEQVRHITSNEIGNATLTLFEGYTLVDIKYPGKEPWQIILSNHGHEKNINVYLKEEIQNEVETQIVYVEKEIPAPVIKNVKVDVGAVIVFDNIYYDYNSDVLTTGAKRELDLLLDVMKNNSNIKIQLSAHTDSRGKAEYNMNLSERRAMSAKSYLVSKGVPSNQMIAVGFGENQLRNHCADDVSCSEAEHIYNRRTEVKILQK